MPLNLKKKGLKCHLYYLRRPDLNTTYITYLERCPKSSSFASIHATVSTLDLLLRRVGSDKDVRLFAGRIRRVEGIGTDFKVSTSSQSRGI
jgi:hypothetical protein